MNYKIGVYGDDTQTEYILVDGAEQIRDRRTTIACNPNLFLDQDTIRSVMIEAMVALAATGKTLHPDGRLAQTVLCMPGSQSFWRGIAARIPEFSPVSILGTYVPALELATGGQPGLVLDCGRLNSFVAARGADGTVQCAGNFGWRLVDAGSDYDLGRRALIRTMLELQGWAASSDLGRTTATAMKSTDANVLAILLDAPPTTPAVVADLAQHVFTLAAAGDEVANTIMRESVGDLARLASTVLEKPFGRSASAPVGLSGPLLHTATAREALILALGENANFVPVTEAPVEGLRRLLARL